MPENQPCSKVQPDPTHTEQQRELNNMLSKLAREGDGAALAQLWEINRPVLRRMFWRWYDRNRELADAAGVTLEDFEQEGFFAVKQAAEYHDPEKGSFLTALQFFVRRQIRAVTIGSHGRQVTAADGRTVRVSAEPLNSAASLDEPMPGDTSGESDRTRADAVPDPAAAQAFEDAEREIYQGELRAALDNALALLPKRQREIISGRFLEGLTQKQAGERVGASGTRAGQIERMGLRALRQNKVLRRFYGEDILARSYRGVGFGAWSRGGSVEERITERQEEQERLLAENHIKTLADLLNLDFEHLDALMMSGKSNELFYSGR